MAALGFDVWRDDELPAHRAYAQVIEERLRAAEAVIVLWSDAALKSQWVRAEADVARQAGTLVQASTDGTMPPIPFNQIQCADLHDWSGDTSEPGWCKVAASVTALLGPPQRLGNADHPLPRQAAISVCVLPFANMSGDPEQEYFSDGISEDITTDLSKISALDVIARNTAFAFKAKSIDLGEIARKLGVSHILEGSVRKAGNRVRITAQLIDGRTGGHLWAERYDRDLDDIFAIQDEISKAIVGALRLKLLPAEKRAITQRGTTSAEAYNLYLMARQCLISGGFGDRRREERVIQLCKLATDIDPDYPQPWALMALEQSTLHYGFVDEASRDDGNAAAQRALSLDPTIAEAYCPKAWHLAERGQFDEANAEIANALRLNPQSWEVHKEAARLFYRQRRIEAATQQLETATKLMDADFHGWGMLLACYNALGNREGMARCATKIMKLVDPVIAEDPGNGAALVFGALSLALLGQPDRAREWIDRALVLDPDNMSVRYNLAWGMIARFDDKEAAIEMMRSVLTHGGRRWIRLAANDPNLDGLRDDPRFQQFLTSAMARSQA